MAILEKYEFIILETNLEKVIEYPGKQDFLQFGGTHLPGNLLAIFGRSRHALRCFESKRRVTWQPQNTGIAGWWASF
jgi:hypothetical protein